MKALRLIASAALAASAWIPIARADVITDWNDKACAIVGKVGPGAPGHRFMAIVPVSVYDAVSSITGSGKPYLARIDAPRSSSSCPAVRHGGGNKVFAAETGWTPFINTPMHPE